MVQEAGYDYKRWTPRVSAAVLVAVAVLFLVNPHALGFLFMVGAAGGMFCVERICADRERTNVSKGVFLAEWIACWVLAFGFKYGLFDLLVSGLGLVLLANVADLWVKGFQKGLWIRLGWFIVFGFVLSCVWLGRTPLGPLNYE